MSWTFNPFTGTLDFYKIPGSGVSQDVTVDFGAAPGKDYLETTVIGQAGIETDSLVTITKVFKSTTDHSAEDVLVSDMDITVGNIVAGIGFTIYIVSKIGRLTGKYPLRFTWI